MGLLIIIKKSLFSQGGVCMSGHGKGFGANPGADLPVARLYLPVDRPAGIQAEGERSGPENEEKETGGEDYEEKNVESCTGRRYDSCSVDRLRRFCRNRCRKHGHR